MTAVLVGRNGAQFLPRTLRALAAQVRRPDVLVAADAGSTDDTRALLARATPHVVAGPAVDGTGADRGAPLSFATAVQAALDGAPVAAPPADATVWLWLLHDDCAPAPDALARLLEEVETSPSVAVAGCKQVLWDDDQRLLEVGVSTTVLGARITGLDRAEVDQGQHDDRRDVLAVGTAGMLVRRDVWDALGADPALPHTRTDVDLCRRAHLAGHRVVVVPRAVVAHADATRAGRRPGGPDWYAADRREALHSRLATAPAALVAPALVWSVVAALVRAVGWLVLKRPDRALAEPVALLGVLGRPAAVVRSRRRQARARRVPRRVLRRLGATPRQLWRQRRDEVSAWIVPRRPVDPPMRRGGRSAGRRFARRVAPLAAVLVGTLAAALAGARQLVPGLGAAPGVPVGPFLLPAPDGAARLWGTALSSWRELGLGLRAPGDPFAALLAVLSLPLGGDPQRAVTVLLVGALPLSALAGWAAASVATRSRPLRTWAALGWACAPPLLLAVAAGRPAAVVAHVALPAAAAGLARALRPAGRPPVRGAAPASDRGPGRAVSVPAAAGAGLALTVVLAAAPSLAAATVLVLAALLVCAVTVRDARAAVRRGLVVAFAAAVPAVLLLPWWVAVARAPRLLLADPAQADAATGSTTGTTTGTAAAAGSAGTGTAWELAAGAVRADVDRLPALVGAVGLLGTAVLVAGLLLLSLLGPLRRSAPGRAAVLGWAAALAGLATVLLAGRVPGAPTGPALSLLLLGLGAAAVVAAGGLRRRAYGRTGVERRARTTVVRAGRPTRLLTRVLTPALVAGTVLGPVAVLGGWAVQGWTADLRQPRTADAEGSGQAHGREVRRADPDVLPSVAAAEASGPGGIRTLVLSVGATGVRWSLARAAGPRLGNASAALPLAGGAGDPDDAVLTPAVAGLLADAGQDVRGPLADLAVGSVLLVPPVDDAAALVLDASPGLVRVAASREGVLWRVDHPGGRPTRVRIAPPAVADRAAPADPAAPAPVAVPSRTAGEASRSGRADVVVDSGVPAGPPGRRVVLADRADAGWRAWLDGEPLTPALHAGWAQAFELPPDGGRLVVEHGDVPGEPGRGLDLLRGAALAVVVVASLPLPRVRRRVAPPPPPRASRPVPRTPDVGGAAAPTPRVFDEAHPEEGDLAPILPAPPPSPREVRRQRLRRHGARLVARRPGRRDRAPRTPTGGGDA